VKLTDLRGILQYIPQFRDKTFIISVDGAVVTGENFGNLLMDVAVLRSLNIRVVIVHGASAQIQAMAEESGVKPSNLDGSGVTDGPTLKLALTAANRLTHELLEGLAANDLRAAATNSIVAHPLGILQGVDHLYTGKVEKVDVDLLQKLLEIGIIPVLPPLGFDGDGKTYRVNSDSVAVAVAEALKAVKLMFITSQDGIRVRDTVIRQMPVADLESVLAMQRTEVHPQMLSKAIHAVAACKAGVPRIHVINSTVEEGLLAEVFTNEGVGTLIYGNEFQQIRRALKKDVRSILNLTKASVASNELMKRTRPTIEKQLGDYYIFEIDRNPVACVALHLYPEHNKGELGFLYVSPAHENQGIGRKLIQFVENKARELNLDELLTLSTQAFTYFQSKGGFVEGGVEDLPPARREKYEQSGRMSKILVKKLTKPPAPPAAA
jgi:amino-acid N-acetyltransferase